MKKYIFLIITLLATLSVDAQHNLFDRLEDLDAMIDTTGRNDNRTVYIHYGCIYPKPQWEMRYFLQRLPEDRMNQLREIFTDRMEHGETSYHKEIHEKDNDEILFQIRSNLQIDKAEAYKVMGCPVSGTCMATEVLSRFDLSTTSVGLHFYQDTLIERNDKALTREIDKALYKILKKGKTTTHRFAYDDPHDHSQKEFQSLSNLPKHTEGVIYDYSPKDHKLFSQFVSTIYSYLYAGESFYLMHNKSYSDTLTAWTSVDCTDNPYIKESARGETFTSHDGKKIMNVKSPKGGETITFALGHHNEPGYIIWSIYYGDGDFRVLRAEGKQGACVPNNWKIYDSIDPEIQKLFTDKKRKK